ncbi:MAG: hypothetical protein LBD43_03020 [Holosporales bacterium]|nr:hypothetical protein [Holosporales bacterium]
MTFSTEILSTGFNAARAKCNELLERERREKDPQKKQQLAAEIQLYARILTGVVDSIGFASVNLVKPFCELLQVEAQKVRDSSKDQSDPKATLKAKRDANRLEVSAKFLTMCATLHDALNKDQELLSIIVSRIPEDVQHIAREITTMLHIAEMIIKNPTDIELPVNKMIELSSSADDGTYLLSRTMTCLMSQPTNETIDIKMLLSHPGFPGEGERTYLPIW